ncbi:ferritin-like domain-containing protein [Parendozoicomonas haliclonae]|uniref:Ferritin-like domain protein n=1 Tax=Parendozoicomonas haliclonae TaxID=1960125 RepID=A0A1X7ANG8_9GAMM|nr:ferritin-like domain-containing protein [Parendozoicomonas haliclonae]SMA49844.1 Ferritin-like domain protein [Parendozoicomonas haliclonae]
MSQINPAIVAKLNEILEHELAGVVRYTHYSFMVFGYSRIPIVGWLRSSANETLMHAHQAGEMITHLGAHPSLGIGRMLETSRHDIKDIMEESLAFEREGVEQYYSLLELVTNEHQSSTMVMLEEYARTLIQEEEQHVGDIDKMLRKPGTLESVIE